MKYGMNLLLWTGDMAADYNGYLTVEAFGLALPELAAATNYLAQDVCNRGKTGGRRLGL